MKFVLFHGTYGSAEGNWFPYLKKCLESVGQKVLVPQFPVENWSEITKLGEKRAKVTKQTLQNWIEFFERIILPKIKKRNDVVFVGHSLAPVFILHCVEKFKIKLDCAIFVSPFLELPNNIWQIDLANKAFYKKDFDFGKLKRFIPTSYVLYSDNDPYVEKKYLIEFGMKLRSSFIEVKGGKHLNAEFGWTKFPLVFELCKTRIDAKKYL